MKRCLAMLVSAMLFLSLLGFSVPAGAQPVTEVRFSVPAGAQPVTEVQMELFDLFMAGEISEDLYIELFESIPADSRPVPKEQRELCERFMAGEMSEKLYSEKLEEMILAELWAEHEAAFRAQFTDDEWAEYLIAVDESSRNRRPDGDVYHEIVTALDGECTHNWVGQGGTRTENHPDFIPTVYCHYRDYYYDYIQCSKCGDINNSPPPYMTSSKLHPPPVFYAKPGGGQGTKCSECPYRFS